MVVVVNQYPFSAIMRLCISVRWQFAMVFVVVVIVTCAEGTGNNGNCVFQHHLRQAPDLSILAPIMGKRFTAYDKDQGYQYEIGICAPASVRDDAKDAGVLQTKDGAHPRVVGKFTHSEFKNGTDWIMLEYRNGTEYGSHCGGSARTAVIMITCDPDIKTLQDVKVIIVEEAREKEAECYYLFELAHSCMCHVKQAQTSLSYGSIAVIVFICVCGVYLLAGFLYNRFVQGAKGMEQIPNYHFWMDFGNLQADGCNLLCRSGAKSESPSYKGIADDQLADDDEHDEHLLPM